MSSTSSAKEPGPIDPGPPLSGLPLRLPAEKVRPRSGNAFPRRGIVAGGGGHVSSTWRVQVDLDSGELTAARTDERGKRILGPLGNDTRRQVPTPALVELEESALWLLENDETRQVVNTVDSMHLLIIVDDDRAYKLSPHGPITEGPAAELRRVLCGLAWPPGTPR